jgi:hypothetical protein
MVEVTIHLNDEQQERARAIAVAERKSEQDIYRDAISAYLMTAADSGAEPSEADYEPLRKMLGMVEDGPSDLSVTHDLRPADPV